MPSETLAIAPTLGARLGVGLFVHGVVMLSPVVRASWLRFSDPSDLIPQAVMPLRISDGKLVSSCSPY